ncbi:hypothetical protein ECP029943810_5073 [Escherichia coli P0299438.10]|nr:hypothetical protein ECP029943810_5073 [Escherichia coli P0299438.10]
MPCYPGLWQISFPERKLSKTDGMNTVSPKVITIRFHA